MTVKRYAERDAMALDKAGSYYVRHVMAMTSEGLHSKGDIAAELGWRDMQIDAIQQQVNSLAAENANIKIAFSKLHRMTEEAELYGDLKYIVEPSEYESLADVIEETPATDSIIREIKAQGSEYIAHKFRVRALNSLPVAGWIDAARAAEEFAAALRNGEQGGDHA